jgi:hypothetical protein
MTDLLLDEEIHIFYSQFYLVCADVDAPDMDAAFEGAVNGICGASVEGSLFLLTGVHTGAVRVMVEHCDFEPRIKTKWEDIVESSVEISDGAVLQEWDGRQYDLDIRPGSYRIRYSAIGMDEGRRQDTVVDGAAIDTYQLEFWQAPMARDLVVKVKSRVAAERHDALRGVTSAAVAEQLDGLELTEADKAWRGHPPNQRLADVGGYARDLIALDRDFAVRLSRENDETLREIARVAALDALVVAGLDGVEVAQPAVEALRRGLAPPAPFNDRYAIREILTGVVPETTVARVPFGGDDIVQQDYAINALMALPNSNALKAAVNAVVLGAGTRGPDFPSLLSELRRRFPSLG